MTPQEIFEYRNQWRSSGHRVTVHSDLEHCCRSWCRENLEPEQWCCTRYTNVYQHDFLFESAKSAALFDQYVNSR